MYWIVARGFKVEKLHESHVWFRKDILGTILRMTAEGRKALVTELIISVFFWNLIIPLWERKTLFENAEIRIGLQILSLLEHLWSQLPSFPTVDCLSSASFHSSCRRRTCTSAHGPELVLGEQGTQPPICGLCVFFRELCGAPHALERAVSSSRDSPWTPWCGPLTLLLPS